jgi:hypothetical protein
MDIRSPIDAIPDEFDFKPRQIVRAVGDFSGVFRQNPASRFEPCVARLLVLFSDLQVEYLGFILHNIASYSCATEPAQPVVDRASPLRSCSLFGFVAVRRRDNPLVVLRELGSGLGILSSEDSSMGSIAVVRVLVVWVKIDFLAVLSHRRSPYRRKIAARPPSSKKITGAFPVRNSHIFCEHGHGAAIFGVVENL